MVRRRNAGHTAHLAAAGVCWHTRRWHRRTSRGRRTAGYPRASARPATAPPRGGGTCVHTAACRPHPSSGIAFTTRTIKCSTGQRCEVAVGCEPASFADSGKSCPKDTFREHCVRQSSTDRRLIALSVSDHTTELPRAAPLTLGVRNRTYRIINKTAAMANWFEKTNH